MTVSGSFRNRSRLYKSTTTSLGEPAFEKSTQTVTGDYNCGMNYKKESQTPNNELVTKFRSLIRGIIILRIISCFPYQNVFILIKESDINFPMSDELLLCFIRARKNDLHRALKMVIYNLKHNVVIIPK